MTMQAVPWELPSYPPSTNQIRVTKLVSYVRKIDDLVMRDFVYLSLFFAPRSYWEAPSSVSGKHHPKDECCEGGQLIHVLRALGYADILIEIHGPMYPHDKGIIYASTVLHDIAKFGFNNDIPFKSYPEHGALAEPFLRQIAKYYVPICRFDLNCIVDCIISHHGRWGKILPITTNQKIVHMADAIAAIYKEDRGEDKS